MVIEKKIEFLVGKEEKQYFYFIDEYPIMAQIKE